MSLVRYLQYLSGVAVVVGVLYLGSVIHAVAKPDPPLSPMQVPVAMAPWIDADAAQAIAQQPVARLDLGAWCLYLTNGNSLPVKKADLALPTSAPCP